MRSVASTELPAWAQVSDRRRAHIERVTAVLDGWSRVMRLSDERARAWHDVGLWHDALRDAPDETLRSLSGDYDSPLELLHGPAAAEYLERCGEQRRDVLDAVRWHTVGHGEWGDVGRALYMADFLEPGRKFMQRERAFLAAHVPLDFDGVFREVVRRRLEWSLREDKHLFPQTVAMWNAVR
jgi:HD superfamily phosphohydrolase YqeK